MEPFDLLGPLPTGTTVMEASAGTGKTYAVGALVTRFVAEGVVRLDEMLVITFGRAASQELRERVREQLVEAERELADPDHARTREGLIGHLAAGDDADVVARRQRIVDALADFDGATIATTHQFCQLVLRSLGVAGDTDAHTTLVEDLDELVVQVADDVYLQRYGDLAEPPPFGRETALEVARAAVGDPQATLAPTKAAPGSFQAERVEFGERVRAELDRRKQRLGVLSYDDLLSRLADALDADDAPARDRMRQRWKVVLVDEFQDTDPVQWNVLDRAFSSHATMVLIGDPKQAIYAFRGGDIVTYLEASGTAGTARTLATNHRSDQSLVDALQVLMRGAQLGDPRISVHAVEARHGGSRLGGLPAPHPVRLRVVERSGDKPTIDIGDLRALIAADLADDVARLLSSGATFTDDGHVRPVRAGDIAVLVRARNHADPIRVELQRRNIPSVVTSDESVLLSPAGDEWLTLLEALEQQRTPRVRAVALTSFVGMSPQTLDAGGDALADDVAEQVRGWLDLFRARGVAAVHESITAGGLAARVLARPDGERLLTDLHHLAQVLHDVAHRERLGLPALVEWLRRERRRATASTERTRRLDRDAAAVQIVTVHGSKGLQYPIVYLPMLFDRWIPDAKMLRFHEGTERMLDVGGSPEPAVGRRSREEDAAEELRLTYVALTRAQSQVVCWWAPSWNAMHSGLSRMMFGRRPGDAVVPDHVSQGPPDHEIAAALGGWEAAGALHLETVELDPATVASPPPDSAELGIRTLGRSLDTTWRRTSYSGLIRAEEQVVTAVVDVEPEEPGTVDEDQPDEDEVPESVASADDADHGELLLSPMNDLPAGATFGSLVHGVLEHADPEAPDLRAELLATVTEQMRWWPVDAAPDDLADGLMPMQVSSLGPLAGGLRLADIPASDRLCELDFEFPLAGGDRPSEPVHDTMLREVGLVLSRHLSDDDPMRAYADRLESPSLGDQQLRGYLSGSIDVVLRVPDGSVGHRYLVVDYKTNKLGVPDEPITALDYTPDLMADAMLHSHYPLQAVLYSVVLHRFLRWRQPDYDPEQHLGGILYLYVRGMCGPETPVIDGQPCGVFAWHPPAAMIIELSELLAGQVVAP